MNPGGLYRRARKPINRGAISIAVLKDPTELKWARTRLGGARKILKKQIPNANTKDGEGHAGMASAMSSPSSWAGQNLTRTSLMKAARTQNQPKHPLLIPEWPSRRLRPTAS